MESKTNALNLFFTFYFSSIFSYWPSVSGMTLELVFETFDQVQN